MSLRNRKQILEPAVFFVTFTTLDHQPYLVNASNQEIAVDVLLETALIRKVRIAAYVIMSTHIHFIAFFPEGGQQLSKFISTVKGVIRKRLRGNLRMWEERFDHKVIGKESMLIQDINYIHQNPVRAGLVKNEIDYLYSSAAIWNGKRIDARCASRIDEITKM